MNLVSKAWYTTKLYKIDGRLVLSDQGGKKFVTSKRIRNFLLRLVNFNFKLISVKITWNRTGENMLCI